jgi:hypothetical protein
VVAQVSRKRPVYAIEVTRAGQMWSIAVPEVPGALSLVRNLAQAEPHIREAIGFVLGVPGDGFDVVLAGVHLPGGVEKQIVEARSISAHAEQLQRQAAQRMRHAVTAMRGEGISGSDIGRILGVSPQRVSQLLAG